MAGDASARGVLNGPCREDRLCLRFWGQSNLKTLTADKCGWDLTVRPPLKSDGFLPQDRHIEVKGRSKRQSTITVSRNEIFYALNLADKFLPTIVLVEGDKVEGPYYIR
ncbi:DUF3883 domain-containing protein [Edwardsiella tarda]